MNAPCRYDGVTTVMRGHARPSARVAGAGGVATVHGQPVRPGGGAGKSESIGIRCTVVERWDVDRRSSILTS